MSRFPIRVALLVLAVAACCAAVHLASEPQQAGKAEQQPAAAKPAEGFPDPAALLRLSPNYDIWLDTKRKLVVVDGKVVLREGLLEMFACPKETKEHESIVAVNCNAQFVHAGLVALGAEPGRPVSFTPEYTPASGPVVDVWVLWKDAQGRNQKVRAQEWILQTKTNKTMPYEWVFGGSGVTVDETTGQKYYLADGGDFICVSNFTSAMLDLPIESSQSNADLTFRANTQQIPPLGTEVRLVLQPRLPAPKSK